MMCEMKEEGGEIPREGFPARVERGLLGDG
jgi:hypothetical protein